MEEKPKETLIDLLKRLESKDQISYRISDRGGYRKIDDDLRQRQAEKEEIKNEGLRQDIIHKRNTLAKLFKFLTYETIAVFAFSFFQAINFPFKFHLEEWSFRLLVGSTISQITIMLLVAVKHLFPDQNKK